MIVDDDALTAEENELLARARNAIQEYRLISSGAASFESLGYGSPPPMVKMLEYLAVDSDVKEALEEARKHGN